MWEEIRVELLLRWFGRLVRMPPGYVRGDPRENPELGEAIILYIPSGLGMPENSPWGPGGAGECHWGKEMSGFFSWDLISQWPNHE